MYDQMKSSLFHTNILSTCILRHKNKREPYMYVKGIDENFRILFFIESSEIL